MGVKIVAKEGGCLSACFGSRNSFQVPPGHLSASKVSFEDHLSVSGGGAGRRGKKRRVGKVEG